MEKLDIPVNVKISTEGAKDTVDKLDEVKKKSESAGESGKKAGEKAGSSWASFGNILKASGIIGILSLVWDVMKKNQKMMDLVTTAMNALGIIIKPVVDAISDLIKGIIDGDSRFDAIGRTIKNLITVALAPLKISFFTIKLAVQELILGWYKLQEALGKKVDPKTITDLKDSIENTKKGLDDTAETAVKATVGIVKDFKETAQEIGAFGKDLAHNVTNAVNSVINGAATAMTNAEKSLKALDKAQEQVRFKALKAEEIQRQIRDDDTKSFDERIAANNKLGELLKQQLADEMAIVDKKVSAAATLLSLDKDNVELQDQYNAAVNERYDLEERINGQMSEQLNNDRTLKADLLKQEQDHLDEIKKLEDEANEARKKGLEAQLGLSHEIDVAERGNKQATLQQTISDLEYERTQRIANASETGESVSQIMTLYAEKIKNAENAAADEAAAHKKQKLAETISAVNDYANATSSILDSVSSYQNQLMQNELNAAGDNEKKKEEIQKKYAKKQQKIDLAKAFIGTSLAIINASQTRPYFPMGLAMAAAAAIMGSIQVATIMKQKFAKGTTNAPGGLSLVGEEGPEIVDVPAHSTVYTNSQTNAMLGNYATREELTSAINSLVQKINGIKIVSTSKTNLEITQDGNDQIKRIYSQFTLR